MVNRQRSSGVLEEAVLRTDLLEPASELRESPAMDTRDVGLGESKPLPDPLEGQAFEVVKQDDLTLDLA